MSLFADTAHANLLADTTSNRAILTMSTSTPTASPAPSLSPSRLSSSSLSTFHDGLGNTQMGLALDEDDMVNIGPFAAEGTGPCPTPGCPPTSLRLDTPENLEADLDALCLWQSGLLFLPPGSSASASPSPTTEFRLAPEHLNRFQSLLRQLRIARFSYDFPSSYARVVMVESTLHAQAIRRASELVIRARDDMVAAVSAYANGLQDAQPAADAAHLAIRLENLLDNGAAKVELPGGLLRQPDMQLIDLPSASKLPPFVLEIAFGQTRQSAAANAKQYLAQTDGRIRAVLILDFQYPKASSVRLGLWTAHSDARVIDPVEVQNSTLFDADVDGDGNGDGDGDSNAPVDGTLRLFASDFLSIDPQELPQELSRPSPGGPDADR
ncbi:hypothetical protein CSHISOI_03235 [Colletotrichum shisoi]|uniref:Uncharacterized protein n=1 Tax=Colletotrichum shisoi TaxID=2078593 RepID=A0A5Q4BZ49_9PEZI|nr:hypothetical protein CSHISOI_03235 [Colletotrichum shisoi]